MAFSPHLAVMEQAAREAGVSLLADFANRENLLIETKKPGDFVSQADRRSEEIIVGILRKAYPNWGVMAEEGTAFAAGAEETRWIIDPLDATTNFLHGIPHWCISIGLEKGGEIIAATIFDPVRNELFQAEKGQGAFLNGLKMQASKTAELDLAIAGMSLITEDEEDYTDFFRIFQKSYSACANVITSSSTALDLAYIAAGRLDIYYSKGCSQPWDMAAGLLLIREAGGIITNHDLSPASIYKNEIVAGNPILFDAFTELTGLH